MALPAGITTCMATFGRAIDVLGVGALLEITITPSHSLVWEATGDIIIPFPVTASASTGMAGSIELPHTNQAGFVDLSGNDIVNWWYIVEVVIRRTTGSARSTYNYLVQIPVGQTTIDIDMVPHSTTVVTPTGLTPTAVVTSVDGQTGAVDLGYDDLVARVSNLEATDSAFVSLKTALADTTRSAAIQVLSDSTADGTTDWFYRLAQSIAADYPGWSVHHKLWSDVTQSYGATTVIQTGTAGVRYLDGTTGTTTRRMAASQSPYISGVLDVRMKLSLTDWTPAAAVTPVGKSGADPQRGWYATLATSTGRPAFTWSPTGLASGLLTRTVTVAPTVADGAITWIRWVFTPDNGAGGHDFAAYQSADGITWTQLGATVTTAGTTSIYNNSTTGYEVGGVASGIAASARVYEVEIRDGLNGPIVTPVLPDLWPPFNNTAATVVGAPILTFVNGSMSGATIAYLNDAARLPKLTPPHGQRVAFLSASHNEGTASGAEWLATYDTWRAAVESRFAAAPIVVLTQNPESSGTPWYREHATRRIDLLGYARRKGLSLIDVYQAFLAAGWPGTLMADDVHPNAAGSDVWRNTVKAVFDAT